MKHEPWKDDFSCLKLGKSIAKLNIKFKHMGKYVAKIKTKMSLPSILHNSSKL
jgi:hypothetical protein